MYSRKSRTLQSDSSTSWDFEITSAVLCKSYTGYPYGHVCCTNNAYVQSQPWSSTEIHKWSRGHRHCYSNTIRLALCQNYQLSSTKASDQVRRASPFRIQDLQRGTSSHKTFQPHPQWMVLNENWRRTVLQKLFVVNDVNMWLCNATAASTFCIRCTINYYTMMMMMKWRLKNEIVNNVDDLITILKYHVYVYVYMLVTVRD